MKYLVTGMRGTKEQRAWRVIIDQLSSYLMTQAPGTGQEIQFQKKWDLQIFVVPGKGNMFVAQIGLFILRTNRS